MSKSELSTSLKNEDSEDGGGSTKEKLSIQQILEGMTNEFNKTGTRRHPDGRRINRTEPQLRKVDNNAQIKAAEEIIKAKKTQKFIQHEEEIKIIKENIPEPKIDKVNKDEEIPKQDVTNKKDGNNVARIVLTFRTIDENTDFGKKTKISSCASNLSLVPDELANCDQIGGVSVKIENFDEVCNNANKTDDNNKGDQKEKKEEKINLEKELSSDKISVQEPEKTPEKKKQSEAVDQSPPSTEISPPVTRRSKRHLEASNEEGGLKRSARRLSKELSKSTVLESAMARKERSNNTEDNTKRKYSRPGRPRKNFPDKKDNIPKLTPIDPTKWTAGKQAVLEKKNSSAEIKNSSSNETSSQIETQNSDSVANNQNHMQEQTSKESVEKNISVEKNVSTENKNNLLADTNIISNCSLDNLNNVPENDVIPIGKEVSLLKKSNLSNKKSPNKKSNLPELSPLDPTKYFVKRFDNLPKLSPLIPQNNFIIINNDNSVNLENSANKYEGMPKLTPIIKNCEILQPQFLSGKNVSNNRSLLKVNNEAFLKPNSSKLKRDRSRGKMLSTVRNTREDSAGGSLSPATESTSSMDDMISEDNLAPVKRTRRSMVPSPSTAEGQASKPESTAVLSKSREKKVESMQCLCEVRSQLMVTITSGDSPLFCTALDSIDNRIVGCTNEVDNEDVAMRRPSSKIPYVILCRTHKERLIRHNCCPTCGFFCSQGKFVHCSNGHQYHRDCELYYDDKPLCPHCGSYGLSYDVIITMTGKKKPVSVPPKKQVPKEPMAKITLPGSGDNTKLAEQQPTLKKSTEPLISPDFIKIPEPTVGEEQKKYTVISLYNAVKNGDTQKLVNVLAAGFNANHAFRDQSHRTSLHIAAEKGFLACVHILVQAGAQLDVLDRNQLSPLMLAAGSGNLDIVRYMMRIGADETLKGEDGMTALHMAAKAGHIEVCKIILSECKVPRTLVDSVDDGGWTSLIWACEFRHANVVRFLLDNKCDPLIRDAEQNIALHWSAFSGSSEITELLLNMGCDPNAVNVHGDTPLHIASRQDQYAVSVLLLSRGAKVGEVNNRGETAIDCCGGTGDTLNTLRLNFKVNQNAENLSEKTIRILTNDISRGKETNPVQCVNGYDSEDKPTDFVYVTENCFTSRINVDRTITSLQSCRCEDNCSSDKCHCGNISLRCWYDDVGKLIPEFNYADPPMLFECNPACDCNKITCNNRVVQHGLTQRFQLFRTEGKGWGLKTLRFIAKGTYVCEYVGEIISDSEADHREDDSYLFDLDNRDGETYCIDARRYGNLARFINHSCAPNLLPVRVYIEHQDLHFPRIAFFANRDIDADEELGFDYGEKFWIIKCKSFTCTCGAENCRYSESTIQITLDNYRKKIQREEMNAAPSAML